MLGYLARGLFERREVERGRQLKQTKGEPCDDVRSSWPLSSDSGFSLSVSTFKGSNNFAVGFSKHIIG
jgi:hypothetical protein